MCIYITCAHKVVVLCALITPPVVSLPLASLTAKSNCCRL